MADDPSPPDPGSGDVAKKPPKEDAVSDDDSGSADTKHSDIPSGFVKYEFGITVPWPRTMNDHWKGTQPHEGVCKAINLIREHMPNLKLFSAITGEPLPLEKDGKFSCTKESLGKLAEQVFHHAAPSRAGYKFIVASPWGDMDTIKDAHREFRMAIPKGTSIENCLNGYPLRASVGFLFRVSPKVNQKDVADQIILALSKLKLDVKVHPSTRVLFRKV